MARGWLFLCLVLGFVPAATMVARAAPPPSVYLEELTWPELRDQIRAGKTTILVPIGGTEQNGPQMAIGKHNVRVKVLSGKIAHALGDALVAPVVAYVIEGDVDRPSGHLKFPGTITAPPDAFEKILEYAGKSLKLSGFRNIVFLGDSGDNQKADAAAAQRLNREWKATPVRAFALGEYYHASEVEFAQLLKSKGYSEAEIGPHAGLLDTSLMMATDPSLVRTDLLTKTRPGDGVHGDPSRASAALGQLGVDLIVARSVAAIREAVSHR